MPEHIGQVISFMGPTLLPPTVRDGDTATVTRDHVPPRTGFPYLDEPTAHGGVTALAHRGGARHPDVVGLENTLHAFRSAYDLGYRYLETDVHATADGVLMAFHDERLDRVTDRSGLLTALPHREAARVLVGGREPIPSLADLLEELPDARFNIDLKTPGAVEPMVELVTRTRAWDRVCIGSFDERTLRRFRRLMGAPVATTCGVALVTLDRLLPGGHRLGGLLHDSGSVYSVPSVHRGLRIVDAGFVERAHRQGRHVHVWTVDERAEMERLLDLGVDGLITDRTDVLREVLVARGLWEGTS